MPSLESFPVHRLPLVFDGEDCRAAGISRHQLTRLLASPVVETVGPRLYAEAVRWLLADRVERHRGLARHAPRRFTGSALSHESAAVWHGLPHPRHLGEQVMLTHDTAVTSCDDSEWVRLHRAGLSRRRVEVVDGVPVTTLARTAVDCLRHLPLADGLAVADAVVARGTTPGELVEARKEQHRWPGSRRARLGIGLVDGRRESWLESASAAGLHGWLPRPVAQVDVLDPGGWFVGRADMLWPDLRVVGEADGREKFLGMPGADTSERAVAVRLVAADERAHNLEALGLAVVRWGAADLAHPARLAARIRDARPVGALRAVLLCSRCRQELDGCCCAPTLCLAPHRAAA